MKFSHAKCWWQIFGQRKNDEEESKNDEEESKKDEEEISESGKYGEFTHVRAQAEGDQLSEISPCERQ